MIREVIAEENISIKQDIEDLQKAIKALKDTDYTQRKGIQAILRDRLYSLSNKYLKANCIDKDGLENFENIYQQYHALGKNGVMDALRDKVLNLPIETEDDGHDKA